MMEFGPWLPDLVPYGHDGLTVARNVYASPAGYKPIKDVSALTTALGSTWRGGGAFIGLDGTTALLAGTDAGMYAYISGAWVSKYAGSYSSRWGFAQFGGIVIGVNGSSPVKYTIATAAGAALGGTPPTASMIGIVRDFVFLAGNPSNTNRVYWSSINNAEAWTVGTNQCDVQDLPDGGPITGIAGGEFGLVFQDAAIHRFSYVGSPAIFQRDKISDGIGCVANGAIATFGRMTFFLSSRGFYSISDGGIAPIGDQKVNETFWNTYGRADVVNNIRCAIDPKRTLVIWSMPDRLWIYNWTLDRWSDSAISGLRGLSTGINASVTLEGVDTLYPSGIDSVPYSLDDPIFQGGEQMLTLVKSDNIVYSLASTTTLAATLQFPLNEVFPGRQARVRRARLYGDATSGINFTLGATSRLGDTLSTVSAATVTTAGYIPIRITEQFLQPTLDIASGTRWTFARGLELDAAPGGKF